MWETKPMIHKQSSNKIDFVSIETLTNKVNEKQLSVDHKQVGCNQVGDHQMSNHLVNDKYMSNRHEGKIKCRRQEYKLK